MRHLKNASSILWILFRFVVIVGGMTLLLYSQATKFDATEKYSIIELSVVLIAFETGVWIGRHRNAEAINWVRLIVALGGMAVLLCLNATNFDRTEASVLVGVPAVIAVFEGLRTWILASLGSSESAVPASTVVDSSWETSFAVFHVFAQLFKRGLEVFERLPNPARGVSVSIATLIVGSFFGLSTGEVMQHVIRNDKAHLVIEDRSLESFNRLTKGTREERLDALQKLASMHLQQAHVVVESQTRHELSNFDKSQ